jgi:hypothetical protein
MNKIKILKKETHTKKEQRGFLGQKNYFIRYYSHEYML